MNRSKNRYKRVKWLFGKEIEIPEEWKLEKLGNICKIRKGSSISSDLYIGLEHIGQGNNQIENIGNANKFTSTKNIFVQDDVLYGKLRPLLNKVWLATESGYCTTDILPLIPTSKILSRILLFVLTNHDFLWYAVGTSAGTKMPRTSWLDMKKFPVVLPSIQEQQKIASILSAVDTAIVYTQKVIEKAEELKKGLMQKLLTKGIGHTKFKKVKWHFGKEIEIPEVWSLPKFDNVVKTNPPTKIMQNIVPYIPMEAVDTEKPTFNFFEERELSDSPSLPKFQDNDVLFARITPSTENGKTSIVEDFKRNGIASSELTVLRPSKTVLPRYLYYYVKSYRIRQFAISQMMGTTGRQRVPNSVFKNTLNFELPPLSEQRKIISILSGVDICIQKNREYKQMLERLKKGLMQKLLTGQIRIKISLDGTASH